MLDLLFNITDWLRTTFLLDFAFWITETPLSLFMVENFWNVPLAQVVHIVSIAAAFASLLMLTLRVHGKAGMSLPVSDVASRYMPWIWWGLLGIVISGLLMITAEPIRNMVNSVFWIKMGILVVTVLITLGFQRSVRGKALAGGAAYVPSGSTKATGLLLVVLWLLIMLAGRWIAYVPV
ncbi:DUF6644 family protein [Alteraurantiacibacter aquimixticola]|uniref:DUF6644 domain-containing protein n=1 Tax=Alteraurantiacibacter aquimixticola TaxID=2489173 RepID=A0A4T3F959_9SPHN|nr:DUF6644 family protein [Alteraurantiacibacter aquimixticola]TIX51560.1 hypothetical protein E5222_03655 [Alteraurantiacibacter aquimixticola]